MTYTKHDTARLLTTDDPKAFGDARRLIRAQLNIRTERQAFGLPTTSHGKGE